MLLVQAFPVTRDRARFHVSLTLPTARALSAKPSGIVDLPACNPVSSIFVPISFALEVYCLHILKVLERIYREGGRV